jgi:hypothetical protein
LAAAVVPCTIDAARLFATISDVDVLYTLAFLSSSDRNLHFDIFGYHPTVSSIHCHLPTGAQTLIAPRNTRSHVNNSWVCAALKILKETCFADAHCSEPSLLEE